MKFIRQGAGIRGHPRLATQFIPAIASSRSPDIGLKTTSAAIFGQLTWRVTDALRLQPGLRFNHDDKSGKYIATVTNATDTPLTAAQLGVLAPQSYQPSFSNNNVSGNLTLSYAVSQNVMAYASYAHAFQSGGINLNGSPLNAKNQPITADETVAPAKANDYEAGLKTELFNGKVVANVDAFWTAITDFQTTVVNSQENVIRGHLASANRARSRGVELDSSARPIRGLNMYLNGAFTDATYVDFPNAPCPPELSDVAGYELANVRAGVRTDGGWDIYVWVRNAFNTDYLHSPATRA